MIRTLLFAVLALTACATAEPAPKPTPSPDASITIWEGGCFYPTCATYEMTLRPDGRYTLDGKANVATVGVREGTLGPDAWTKAEAALAAANFAAMPAMIGREGRPAGAIPCMAHLPGVRITHRASATEEKSVLWDRGCPSAEASALVDALHTAFAYDALVKPAAK
jgi:Domain of unknown function (DUF6438)